MTRSVVHMLAPAAFGGLESVVLTLSRGQAKAGHRVMVVGSFADEPRDQPFWDALQDVPGVHTKALVLGGRQYLKEVRAVRDVLGTFKPDLLHTHGYRPDVLAAPVARFMGVPTVTTVHGFTGGGRKNRIYEWAQRRSFRRFDAVVAVSEALEHELVAGGLARRAVHRIPNAWTPHDAPYTREDARRRLGLPQDDLVVGWVGRLSREKAPELALDALEELHKDAPRVGLSFVGAGPLGAELAQRASARGLQDYVNWHGIVPGAGRYVRAFDALFLTSWTEGTPIVLLEAMGAEVPVVATAVGGIPNVVSPAEAELVAAGDVEGMAAALARILRSPAVARERAASARMRLEREFAVGPWVQRYTELYDSITV